MIVSEDRCSWCPNRPYSGLGAVENAATTKNEKATAYKPARRDRRSVAGAA